MQLAFQICTYSIHMHVEVLLNGTPSGRQLLFYSAFASLKFSLQTQVQAIQIYGINPIILQFGMQKLDCHLEKCSCMCM